MLCNFTEQKQIISKTEPDSFHRAETNAPMSTVNVTGATHLVLLCVQFFDDLCAVLELLSQLALLFLGAALSLKSNSLIY